MQQYELNIRDYWQIIKNRRYIFLAVLISVLIFTGFYISTQQSVYRARASVQFIERRTLGGLLSELVVIQRGDPLIAQSRIITSLSVMELVAVEVGLVPKDATPTQIRQAAAIVSGAVSTSVISDSSVIIINVTHGDPVLAANIANATAKAYIAENLKEATKESRGLREFIEKQLKEVGIKLRNSEDTLAKFQEKETPSGIAVALQNKLAALESERQDFLQIYTAEHPDIKAIDEQIGQLKERMKVLPQKELEYSRLKREVDIDSNLYIEFKKRVEGARIAEAEKMENARVVDVAVPPRRPIRPNKPFSYFTGLVMGIVLGIVATCIAEQLDTSMGTIEDVESSVNLSVLGVIPYLQPRGEKHRAFIWRLFKKKLRRKDKVVRLSNQLVLHYSSSSTAFEAYRILRAKIEMEVFKEEKIKGKVLAISSSGPEEGKSITVSNLAIAFAQGNFRTLLVDCDMRRPVIHTVFGLKDKTPGLSNILTGDVKLKDAIRTFADILMGDLGFDEVLKLPGLDNLSILTSGSSISLPSELLASQEMVNLFGNLRESYDIILIDTAPVMAVADVTILAPKVDGVVLVYRVGRAARSILVRAKTQIVESGGLAKGIILNNISPELEVRYGYYYHYKYYGKYYTSKKTST